MQEQGEWHDSVSEYVHTHGSSNFVDKVSCLRFIIKILVF